MFSAHFCGRYVILSHLHSDWERYHHFSLEFPTLLEIECHIRKLGYVRSSVLVFHMHQVAEALNPVFMNKTRQSKQLKPCIQGESEELELRT